MKCYAIALLLLPAGGRGPSRQLGEFPEWQVAAWEAASRRQQRMARLHVLLQRLFCSQTRRWPRAPISGRKSGAETVAVSVPPAGPAARAGLRHG